LLPKTPKPHNIKKKFDYEIKLLNDTINKMGGGSEYGRY
jgi:hypothetical protein